MALAVAYDSTGDGCSHADMQGERFKMCLKLDGDADCTGTVSATVTFALAAAARTLWVKLYTSSNNFTLDSYTLSVVRAPAGAQLAEV